MMIEAPVSVLTAHETILYIDENSHLLCHGPSARSPKNLAVAFDGSVASLAYRSSNGLRPVICRSDGRFEADCQKDMAPSLADATRLEIVAVGRQNIGLKRNELFLSALYDNGVVLLVKEDCRLWEIFRIVHNADVSVPSYRPDLLYLQKNMDKVEGWLDSTTAAVIHRLLRYQGRAKISGDVLEIGVHHGKLFILLALALEKGERAVAVDVFDDQHLNTSLSGLGDRVVLEKHIKDYAPDVLTEIVKANSKDLGEEFIRSHGGMRFVSIDGDHTREATFSDLCLAERLIVPSGIVALDDVYRPAWSGVTAGLHRYYTKGGKLVPFAMVPNKVLFTLDHHYGRDLRAVIRQEFAHEVAKRAAYQQLRQFFEFDDVINITHDR